MCPPVLAVAAIAASVVGTVMTIGAQQSAAAANARAMEQAAEANARAAAQIAEMNALAEFRTAEMNASMLASTAAAEAQIADANARRVEIAAQGEQLAGEQQEAQQRTRARFLLADQRARYGAAGVMIEGSPLEVLAFSAGQLELDALTIRTNTATRVSDLQAQAAGTRLEGALGVQQAAERGRNLLSDALLRGDTGIQEARIRGTTGMQEAALRGGAMRQNASSQALATGFQGASSVLGSQAAQTLAARWG